MFQIAAEIVLDDEVALVNRRDEGQLVHVLEDGAVLVVHDDAGGVAPGEPADSGEVAPLRHLLDGEIEFVARDKIDRGRSFEARFRLDRDLGPDHADLQARLERLERLGRFDIDGERRGRGVQHHEIAVHGLGRDVVEFEAVRRRVDELGAFNERGRLGEPGRVPERLDLAAHLIARAGAPVEAVEGWRLQEQRPHHVNEPPGQPPKPLPQPSGSGGLSSLPANSES